MSDCFSGADNSLTIEFLRRDPSLMLRMKSFVIPKRSGNLKNFEKSYFDEHDWDF